MMRSFLCWLMALTTHIMDTHALGMPHAMGMAHAMGVGSFYRDNTRGWHWYEPVDVMADQEDDKDETDKASTPKTSSVIVAEYRKKLENTLAKAWIHPTPANIKAYQTLQKDMLDRSQLFSDVWMQSVFSHPELDHTLLVPTNQRARHIYLDQEKQREKNVIRGLSKEYGLFFFFSGNCAYCHAFAPIVKAFASEHGWDVLAISVDGGVSETFANAIPDNGLVQNWNVKVLPALFAVNPHTGHVIPVAYGMVGSDQMIERMMTLKAEKRP